MRNIIIIIAALFSIHANAAKWIVEAEGNAKVTWSKDSVADIHAPGGLTLWNTTLLQGDVVIEYEARILSDARVSDLNCFWMAKDPNAKDVFTNLKARGGKFLNSYNLQLYYMGYGGNYNSTTRFRRYNGDARGVDDAKFRPAILREYLDKLHMIQGDHWYKIRLESKDGRVRYIIDGECLVDFVDPHPLTSGYFGFRTTLSHAQLRKFRVLQNGLRNKTIRLSNIYNRGKALKRTEPATFGILFKQGEITQNSSFRLLTDKGNIIESDQWKLASWPDGSVKWMAFAAVLPQGCKDIALEKEVKSRKPTNKASTQNSPQIFYPQTINKGTHNIFDSICIAGKKVSGPLWFEINNIKQNVNSIEKEQQGNVRNTWRIEGDNFCVRIYTYNGSNEIKITHTAFIDSVTNANGLQSMVLKTEVPLNGKMHERSIVFGTDDRKTTGKTSGILNMDVKPLIARRPIRLDENGNAADPQSKSILSNIASWDGFRLSQLSPNAYSIRKRATDKSPWIGTIEGSQAPGTIAIGDKNSSIAFHLADFWQSYPSTLQVDKARSNTAEVGIYLWSKEAESMSFEHYDTIPHGLDAAYEDIQPGMSTANGIARTSTLYLYPTLESVETTAENLPYLQEHSQYLASPDYLHTQRAFGFWSLDNNTELDQKLKNIMDFYASEQKIHGWYGFFNYGDFMHSYDASRGEWRYDVGGYAWDNTELGTPAMLWYQFLRTGDAKTWDMAVAMTRHCSEVDCYHKGPHAGLGTRHNVLHWGCGAKEARISQAFWNRFLYYLTADERTGDLMHEVVDADQMLYTLDPMRLAQPRSDKYPCTAPARLRIGPDWLAYAGNWFTEWERTGNTKYRDKILAGMKSISSLPNGMFSGPKALGYDPATGIISWEGSPEVQNTNHLLTIMGGFEMMNEMMLSVSTPEWEHTWLEHAKNYKENALTISRNHFRIPRLQGYAYWFTGNEKYKNNAFNDMMLNDPFKMMKQGESQNTLPMNASGGFYTNDAATFTLDAIFLQETNK